MRLRETALAGESSPCDEAYPRQNKTNLVLAAILVALGVAAALTVGPSSSSVGRGDAHGDRPARRRPLVGVGDRQRRGVAVAERELHHRRPVTAVDVKPGQKVTQGQTLGKIDSQSAQLAVDQAEASLNSANAQLTSANQQAQTSYAQALLSLKAAKAGVTNAKARCLQTARAKASRP